ncbi:MAG: site-2 protease family protein [Streptosporangiaceae bacterium]
MALLLFLATLLTTTIVGARLQYSFSRGQPAYVSSDDLFPFPWAWHHPGQLAAGLPFSLALMSILLAHELGHLLACRYYRLDSTLPMFLPAPTLIGTMGAFIRIKDRFLDRREVFDVGIAGPLAGMALTVPLLAYGLATSRVLSPAQAAIWHRQWIEFGWPPLAIWFAGWLHPGTSLSQLAPSPVARAAWMGLLVTMLNLLPAAQLDGGHILYAVSPRVHRVASWSTLLLLVIAGWFYWPGWYVFAAFIALMLVRHPHVPEMRPLGRARAILALATVAIFLAAFTALPVASA